VGNGVLTGKLELLRKEMETKLAMLEAQLEAERRRNKLDFSNLDDKIRSEYAKRSVLYCICRQHESFGLQRRSMPVVFISPKH
jgi:hypothetical protein